MSKIEIIELFKKYDEVCKTYDSDCYNSLKNKKCPLARFVRKRELCALTVLNNKELIDLIERWSNSILTYSDVFLNKIRKEFPDAHFSKTALLKDSKLCRRSFFGGKCGLPDIKCRDCWNEKYKENEVKHND